MPPYLNMSARTWSDPTATTCSLLGEVDDAAAGRVRGLGVHRIPAAQSGGVEDRVEIAAKLVVRGIARCSQFGEVENAQLLLLQQVLVAPHVAANRVAVAPTEGGGVNRQR